MNDLQIDHAQAMLCRQYSYIDGLQQVGVFETIGCTQVGTPTNKFVQMMNFGGEHWITISNIHDTTHGSVSIYDSIYNSLPQSSAPKFLKQVACLIRTTKPQMDIKWVNTEHQRGSADCGLFAIAYAEILCRGVQPETVVLNQPLMRQHLINCFQAGKLIPFPTVGKHRVPTKPVTMSVDVFCHCRQPDDGSLMIECSQCLDWFHFENRLPRNVTDYDFVCRNCQ